MARVFITFVGLAYIGLAAWCVYSPLQTSASVGFSIQPGSGQSEFFTVYGGLQFALGAFFLLPLIRFSELHRTIFVCLWIHGCLVIFRTISFCLFKDIPSMTCLLAAVEWIIFLGAACCAWKTRSTDSSEVIS